MTEDYEAKKLEIATFLLAQILLVDNIDVSSKAWAKIAVQHAEDLIALCYTGVDSGPNLTKVDE